MVLYDVGWPPDGVAGGRRAQIILEKFPVVRVIPLLSSYRETENKER